MSCDSSLQGDISKQMLANLERRQVMTELALLSEGRFHRVAVTVPTLSSHHCKPVHSRDSMHCFLLALIGDVCRSRWPRPPSAQTWLCSQNFSGCSSSALPGNRAANVGLLTKLLQRPPSWYTFNRFMMLHDVTPRHMI